MKKLLALLLCPLLLCGCAPAARPAAGEWIEGPMTVALTFDDGPHKTYTPRLLEGLREREVRATFFLLGMQAAENPAIVQQIAADGHQIGNHSYSHIDLEKASSWEALQDIARCGDVLMDILGGDDYWVRPPYGNLTDDEREALDVPIIKWSVDTEDWKSKDVEKIEELLYRDLTDGAIILMHDCYDTTVDATLRAVDTLQARGVRFVTVAELFAEKGIEPEEGTIYRHA